MPICSHNDAMTLSLLLISSHGSILESKMWKYLNFKQLWTRLGIQCCYRSQMGLALMCMLHSCPGCHFSSLELDSVSYLDEDSFVHLQQLDNMVIVYCLLKVSLTNELVPCTSDSKFLQHSQTYQVVPQTQALPQHPQTPTTAYQSSQYSRDGNNDQFDEDYPKQKKIKKVIYHTNIIYMLLLNQHYLYLKEAIILIFRCMFRLIDAFLLCVQGKVMVIIFRMGTVAGLCGLEATLSMIYLVMAYFSQLAHQSTTKLVQINPNFSCCPPSKNFQTDSLLFLTSLQHYFYLQAISPLILISISSYSIASYSIAIATELIKITILVSSIFVSPSIFIFISISITSVVFHALFLVFSTRCRSRASNGLVGVVTVGLGQSLCGRSTGLLALNYRLNNCLLVSFVMCLQFIPFSSILHVFFISKSSSFPFIIHVSLLPSMRPLHTLNKESTHHYQCQRLTFSLITCHNQHKTSKASIILPFQSDNTNSSICFHLPNHSLISHCTYDHKVCNTFLCKNSQAAQLRLNDCKGELGLEETKQKEMRKEMVTWLLNIWGNS